MGPETPQKTGEVRRNPQGPEKQQPRSWEEKTAVSWGADSHSLCPTVAPGTEGPDALAPGGVVAVQNYFRGWPIGVGTGRWGWGPRCGSVQRGGCGVGRRGGWGGVCGDLVRVGSTASRLAALGWGWGVSLEGEEEMAHLEERWGSGMRCPAWDTGWVQCPRPEAGTGGRQVMPASIFAASDI